MDTPTKYIETRPEAIEAIHKSIANRWNIICMGYSGWVSCELCRCLPCDECPVRLGLEREHDTDCCIEFEAWASAPNHNDKAEAEAMLEALVQLLPESERIIYGGN